MKFTPSLLGLVFLGNAAAFPFSDDSGSLDTRASGKCQWKDQRCCKGFEYEAPEYSPGSHYPYRHTIYVKAHKSIQAAINKASPGDRIVVEAGTYAEQLTIKKDGIELVGRGAILVPPQKAVQNSCSGLSGPGTQTGICVTGSGVKLAKFRVEHRKVISVDKPVKDVTVTGFSVRKFSGINIAILGAKNARVTKNKLADGAKYGSLTLGSYNTLVFDNEVSATGLAGIGVCMDNFSGVKVVKNRVSNYGVGLCVQTNNADVQYNRVSECCVAIFVDPGVKGAQIRHNYVGKSNSLCPGASGIILDGAINTQVWDNTIEAQHNNGMASGVVVVDDECPQTGPNISLSCLVLKHKAVSSGNVIVRNTLRNNDYDIFINSTGTGNVAKCNSCSLPKNLCGK
ncbi:hypothetical protein NM208_g1125 [Fusarium decemcellulare]|uniref:Uncharacterized protein n=1 Tax=Fusarium decemcellulare TaxID=57161 RepID=A0ACC1SX84_9HYPO|nr:hypothetical protein NM208_g1125 [Fusarium decemcellulare]